MTGIGSEPAVRLPRSATATSITKAAGPGEQITGDVSTGKRDKAWAALGLRWGLETGIVLDRAYASLRLKPCSLGMVKLNLLP